MNKAELINAISERTGFTKKAAGDCLDATLDEIVYQVARDNDVILAGFGTFGLTTRAARTARNPRTSEPVEVPETFAPKFKAGATFKRAVNS